MPVNPVSINGRFVNQPVAPAAKAQANGKSTAPAQNKAGQASGASTIVSLGQTRTQASEVYTRASIAKTAAAPSKAVPEPKASVPSAAPAKATPQQSGDGTFVAGNGDVVVDVKNSESGYDNRIYWSSDNFKTRHYIGVDNETGTYNLGKFKPGTKIQFGIDNGVGNFFKTGSASANSDQVEHARVSKIADGIQIGFEDLAGGGDRDYNDAIITVANVPAQNTAAAGSAKSNDNRSGLGDGTNPGQGAGRANSPNTGTENPNNALASATSAAPGKQVDVFG